MNKLAELFNSKSPIRKNIIANLYGVGVNLLNQIGLVPLFIVYWGNKMYADWIVLTSITVVFSMSDVGLNTVIQNRFSMKLAAGDRKDCDRLLTCNVVIVSILFFVSLICLFGYYFISDIVSSLGLHTMSSNEAFFALLLIVCRIYLGMYSGIENAIYRASHKNSRCVYMDQTMALVTVAITAVCLVLDINIVTLCGLLCLPPIINIILKYIDAKKYYHFKFSIKFFRVNLLMELIKPSVMFLSFPIGNAILIQGFTFIVNKYYGADDVVLYNTTRTMCNFIIILLSTIQTSVWPEYSIAFGKKDMERMRLLHSKVFILTIVATSCIGLAMFIFGPYIYHVWTHDKVSFSYTLMSAFLVAIFIRMIWSSSGVTLMATNNHIQMGGVFLISTIISCIVASLCAIYHLPVYCIAATTVIAQIAMAIYTLNAGLNLTNDTFFKLISRYVYFLRIKNN